MELGIAIAALLGTFGSLGALAVYFWVGKRRVLATLTVCAFLFVALFIASPFVGIPDPVVIVGENVTVAMLEHQADEESLQRWFRVIGVHWHTQNVWPSGDAYNDMGTPCRKSCAPGMEAEFLHSSWVCVAEGDRIKIRFDQSHKPTLWRVVPFTDAC